MKLAVIPYGRFNKITNGERIRRRSIATPKFPKGEKTKKQKKKMGKKKINLGKFLEKKIRSGKTK